MDDDDDDDDDTFPFVETSFASFNFFPSLSVGSLFLDIFLDAFLNIVTTAKG